VATARTCCLAEAVQAFTEAGQAFPAALHGRLAQVLLAIEPVALAHRFLEVVHALDAPMFVQADFQPEAVRPQVYGSEKGSVVHCSREKRSTPA